MSTWQLPEGIDELTGDKALAFETLRRSLLDLYIGQGYELVIPPMAENIESLLLTSDSVDEKTFKFLDPASGKMLGVHADITPQIARIDAKKKTTDIQKYCYINAILQTKADDFYASRSPIQAGAELYGSTSIEADIEMIQLMLSSLQLLNISPVVLSLGNVGIFNTLIELEDLTPAKSFQLRQIYVKRSLPDLKDFLNNNTLVNAQLFRALMQLEGGVEVLDEALDVFKDFEQIYQKIQELVQISQQLNSSETQIVIDLAELKAYEYHSGLIFSAYNENYSKAIAQGGRYNSLSESFGHSRAATGFSFDLKFLSQSK